MSIRLRIRHPSGSSTVEIAPGSTAGDVAHLIASLSGAPPKDQVWKAGYPPKKLETTKAGEVFPSEVEMLVVSARAEGAVGTVDFSSDDVGYDNDSGGNGDGTSASGLVATTYFPAMTDPPPLTDPDGVIVRRVIDADNSCLFNSIGYVLCHSRSDSVRLRKKCARAILDDPATYTAAFLGKDPAEYAAWIRKPESWGGEIEMHIFSTLFEIEIAAFDVARDRHDVYGKNEGFGRRCFVMYDGIHYDALAYAFDPGLPEDADVTVFAPGDEAAMGKARYLCREQHGRKDFTDTSSFTLRCLVCQTGLKGAAEAQEHALKTGHANFSEFR